MRPARLAVVTPLPTYPPAQPSPLGRSNSTVAHQSRGTPSTPAQACSILAVAAAGKNRSRIARSWRTVSTWVEPSESVREPNRYGTPRPPSAIRSSAVRCAYM